MFAIIRTRWQTRPLSPRAKRRSSAAPGSLRKKYAGIAHPPNMVRLPNHSTTSGDNRKSVLGNDYAKLTKIALLHHHISHIWRSEHEKHNSNPETVRLTTNNTS